MQSANVSTTTDGEVTDLSSELEVLARLVLHVSPSYMVYASSEQSAKNYTRKV